MRYLLIIASIFITLESKTFAADSKSASKKSKVSISGKLDVEDTSNYRIATVQSDGKSTIAKISDNKKFRFKLNANAAKNTSIHVVSGAGRYIGPVVKAVGSSKASTRISGNKSGDLGNLQVSNGFIQVSKGKGIFSNKNTVSFNSETGTPGSGNLGFVLSQSQSVSLVKNKDSSSKPNDDNDNDGIPNLIDVDDDGDLILDSTDSNFVEYDGPRPYFFSDMVADPSNSLNADAMTVTQDLIDNFVQSNLSVVVGYNSAESGNIKKANVDCLSLLYCGSGGVATIHGVGGIDLPDDLPVGSLWSEYDTDSDGFPNLYIYPSKTRSEIIIKPNVTTSQIAAGDSLLFKIVTAKKVETYPLVLSFIFVTVPAAYSVNDGTSTTTFSYPGTNESAGTRNNPIALTSNNVTINFWRPQRTAIEGAESGTLIEMGNLKYGVDLSVTDNTSGDNQIVNCSADDYSNLSETLSKVASDYGDYIDVLKDSRADSAPDSSQKLSFTINLDSCITRAGLTSSGKKVLLGLKAKDRTGSNAAQLLAFTIP